MPFENSNFINADLGDALKTSAGKAIVDNKLDGSEHCVPTGFKDVGGLFPGQPLRPARQKNLIRKGHPLLAVPPRQRLDLDAMLWAFDAARGIAKIDLKRPDRQILTQPLRLSIISGASLAAFRANWSTVTAWLNINNQGFCPANQHDADGAVKERLETFNFVQ